MSRFILLVLDGFGVGAMPDTADYHPEDATANTALHVLECNPQLRLPNLERLGLMNVLGQSVNGMKPNPEATYGKAKLMHVGADTFYGHQEIVGTRPRPGKLQLFTDAFDEVDKVLKQYGYRTTAYPLSNGAKVMGVEDIIYLSDNPVNDPGQCQTILACLAPDGSNREKILEISRLVRETIQAPRTILHMSNIVSYEEYLPYIVARPDRRGSVDFMPFDLYNRGIEIVHLGYGIDEQVQLSYLAGKHGVPVYHLGKFADIVANPTGQNFSTVLTGPLFDHFRQVLKEQKEGLIAINCQETDLSGHESNPQKYGAILQQVDDMLAQVLPVLGDDDRLIIMADHGNDPIHEGGVHTREYVPILIYGKGIKPGYIGERETMSDVGATILDFLGRTNKWPGLELEHTENGISFLEQFER